MSPSQVPRRVEQQRHGDEVAAAQAVAAPSLEDVDDCRRRKGQPHAGEGDRDGEEQAGGEIAGTFLCIPYSTEVPEM